MMAICGMFAKILPLKEMMASKEILSAMDRKDFDWYSKLDDDKKKQFSSWLFLRYASSIPRKRQRRFVT